MPRVFISSASQDSRFVEGQLIPLLNRHQIETWCASQSIRPGEEWEPGIRRGLNWCDWFLVVISPHAGKSNWVRREVGWAIDQRVGSIIPVMLADCDTSPWDLSLRGIQHVDFRHDKEQAQRRLLAVFGIAATQQPAPRLELPKDIVALQARTIRFPKKNTKIEYPAEHKTMKEVTRSDMMRMSDDDLRRYIRWMDDREKHLPKREDYLLAKGQTYLPKFSAFREDFLSRPMQRAAEEELERRTRPPKKPQQPR